jgi:hypothetical protein
MIQSRYPFIAVETSEEDRLETTLAQIAGDLRVPFFVWTVTTGCVVTASRTPSTTAESR